MKKITLPSHKERGQSLMELAISLMVLLMLLTGAVETSLALFQYVTIRDAAQEGATYGSINPPANLYDPTEPNLLKIQWRTMDAANDVVQIAKDDVEVTVEGGDSPKLCEGTSFDSTAGKMVPNSIKVTVTYVHPITYPFVAAMTGYNTITLHGNATSTILSPTCQ